MDRNAPNSDQPDKARAVHRAQLEAVRAAFAAEGEGPAPAPDGSDSDAYETEYLAARLLASVRGLERRQRRTSWLTGTIALGLGIGGAVLLASGLPALPQEEIYARSIRADRVAVTGDLRLLDAAGNELAVLGREGGVDSARADGPVVLALHADGDPSRQVLRLAASKTGAAVSLDSPSGEASVSLSSMEAGPSLELRSGDKSRRISSDTPVASAGPSAGRVSAYPDVPAWTPRREELPSGAIPEVRDIGHGFLVSDLAVEPGVEGAVIVKGRVINTTSVAHAGLGFRVRVGEASGNFQIYRISPGNSTGFSLELPGVDPTQTHEARVEYVGSTVAYQATSTEPLYGRHAPGY